MNKLALATVAAFASTSASAADLAPRPYVKAPVAERVASWTGFYLGGQVGGAWADRTANFTPDDASAFIFNPGLPGAPAVPGQVAPGPHSFAMSGVTGGVEAGYNWQLGRNWLIGIEGDFSGSNLGGSGRETQPLVAPNFTQTMSAEQKVDWWGSIRARVGMLASPDLLLFATGGFAYGRVSSSDSYSTNGGAFGVNLNGRSFFCATDATCFAGSTSNVQTGWTVGGGGEWRFAPRWSLKLEYLYVNLGRSSVTASALTTFFTPTPSTYTADLGRTDFHVVRAGVNYQF